MSRFALFFSLLVLISGALASCGDNAGRQMSPAVAADSLQHDSIDSLAFESLDSVSFGAEDSLALRLALLPTADCLPFFYAKEKGIYDTLGLFLKIELFRAALDCDTAYLGGSVHGGVSDTLRLRHLREKGARLTPRLTLDSRLGIVGSRVLNLETLEDLRGRTVVGERFSTSQLLIGQALSSRRIGENEYFTPQISGLHIRTSMLDNDQIDAALLPEPFLTLAERRGHKVLAMISERMSHYTCLAFSDSLLQDSLRAAQLDLLLRGYKLATKELNEQGVNRACRSVIVNKFGFPKAVADNVKLPEYK